jgi:hypothetical protein
MLKIKAVEISLLKPAYFDERSLINNISAFRRDMEESSANIGVTIEDIYLDESTNEFVVRFEITDSEEFVGQYRLTAWMSRIAKKHLKYE